MKSPTYSVSMLFAGMALVVTGCNADGASTSPAAGPCNSEAAQGLVGKEKPTDAEALQLTGSKTVRQIQPGDMVTQDFREDRVTIETDPATGLVTRVACG
ncbi:I78 family peptidase inhibitor [Pseudorhizobium marinum]|uniref:I78 family peptidase inhibitor n=1 Tax=Pseudorhizobium marinum TaxID=1496690 RepID=UPI000AA39955|nr:I78 family peptidase inhibitor [Pseudorhizobium marinum]